MADRAVTWQGSPVDLRFFLVFAIPVATNGGDNKTHSPNLTSEIQKHDEKKIGLPGNIR